MPIAPKARSQAVQGSVTQAPSAPDPPPVPQLAPAKPRAPLCAGQMGTAGPDVSPEGLSVLSAPGTAPLPQRLEIGGGTWTWVNFWAAWCAPCKEEIPRLRSWQQRLGQSGVRLQLRFVSLDDDRRQLEQFLKDPGETKLDRTYWLQEGAQREKWLESAGLPADPELPVQLLVDPKGKARCIIQGAVDDADWPRVAELFGPA